MTAQLTAYVGAAVFDGQSILQNHALLVSGTSVHAVVPEDAVPDTARRIMLDGGLLAPGYVDLQVNGGGGVMFNDDPSVDTLRIIAQAHAKLGTTSILPTLITDTPEKTRAAIDAAVSAIGSGVAGIAGLHLEGPHLSLARKGAHDAEMIRPMEQGDLDILVDAARRLPALMITLAPENATPQQVRTLCKSGAVVSLGHSDADFATCRAYASAGASCVTHIFNAMSQLQNREPGLVGAALRLGALSAGLIADGIHVHPSAIEVALAAKKGPGSLFLVTDAMATAGTNANSFRLNGREITRRNGRLTLSDGTLAGADLELGAALRLIHGELGVAHESALAMATSRPADLMMMKRSAGYLVPDSRADFIHLDNNFHLRGIWRKGSVCSDSFEK